MVIPEHYAPIIKQLANVPQRFTLTELGPVTECIWDGTAVGSIELRFTERGVIEFEAEPPTRRCIQMGPEDWTPDFVCIRTAEEFHVQARKGISRFKSLNAPFLGRGPGKMLASCHMMDWTALKQNDEPCMWVTFANIERAPFGLRESSGNLHLEGFQGLKERGHWIFKAKYTTLLLRHELGWLLCIDTGSQEPPGDDYRPELRMMGFLQDHPFNLTVAHRISGNGQITGHAQMTTGHVGHSAPLRGSPTPFLEPLFRIDFFNRAMDALREKPELVRLILVPTGHYFEAHGRSYESCFAHAWIALESLVSLGELHGYIPKGMPKLAEQDRWTKWIDEHKDEIKSFATQGNEDSFLNTVRGFFRETSKVRAAFKKLGLAWTPEMDQLGQLRGQYIHEGTPRVYDPKSTMEQLELLRMMLTALYARIFSYSGPISDVSELRSPEWWPVKETEPKARLVVIKAG